VLVNSLLDVSKLDAGAVQPEPQCVGVRSLIERIAADYRPFGARASARVPRYGRRRPDQNRPGPV